FTDRIGLLTETLRSIQDESGLASIRQREQFDTLKLIDDADDAFQALGYARQYAEEQLNSVGYSVDALDRLIDSLAGLPGRKALLHVSSGVPMLAGEEMFHAVAEKFSRTDVYSEIPRYDSSRGFERVSRRANANRVAFHTLDAGGLRGFRFGAAEYGGFVDTDLRSTLDSVVPENLQSSLRLMAIETGGRAILNRNEILPALIEVSRDFRSFYSLGISAAGADSGRYHEIKVRLKERPKGARLRHRSGYRSKDMRTRMRESLQAALSYAHQDNPLDIQLRWGRLEPHNEKNLYVLPLEIHVPMRDVALLPISTERHEARLELYVGAVGEDGKSSEINQAPLGLRLANEHVEAARAESLLHTHKLLLKRGRQKVGVAILDVFGGQSSIVTEFIEVATQPAD
ncbi:MAG: VWA domain-containing protein, partial [Acidobacteriota bacterium]|nr:VWA domain-containing protein [Acidobacteriota bacterium]